MPERIYRISIIDDEPETLKPIMDGLADILKDESGFCVEYSIYSRKKELDRLQVVPSDIVMFDCALPGADFIVNDKDVSKLGFDLIRAYREANRRTKVIFYSARIKEGEIDLDLTYSELISMINNLNVFRVVERSLMTLKSAISDAIKELDAVMICLESIAADYSGIASFNVGGNMLSINELVNEMRLGTKLGEEFRSKIINSILLFLMSFGEGDKDI